MIKRILVASDGSRTSGRALKTAVEMAKKMGATLTLVGVIDNRLYVGRTMPAEATPTRIAEPVEDYLMRVAGAYLATDAKRCKQSGVKPEMVIRMGHPVEEILKEARRSKAHLLVMGSHGKSGIGSAMGSVAFGVLQSDSRVPVLIVRK
ncbi:MAG: Stress response protein NhaX [Syntrophaceae bacterium PtaB.Bin038]|nr:MAG: Stress response protein NhaX [Syntrophaceae bacterium PtaB.Bin038]